MKGTDLSVILAAMDMARVRGHEFSDVLVCGGRNYENRRFVWDVLDTLGPKFIVTGGQGEGEENRGADRWAEEYAVEKGIPYHVVYARWKEYGKSAGPIRNSLMLKLHPDINLCVAFPGGAGTEDMVTKAARAMIPILRFTEESNGLN